MGEWTHLETLAGADLIQIRIVEQSVLFQFVFHIGKRELCSPHWDVEFGKNPGQGPI